MNQHSTPGSNFQAELSEKMQAKIQQEARVVHYAGG